MTTQRTCERCNSTDGLRAFLSHKRHLRLCNYHQDSLGWDACSEGFKGCRAEVKRLLCRFCGNRLERSK